MHQKCEKNENIKGQGKKYSGKKSLYEKHFLKHRHYQTTIKFYSNSTYDQNKTQFFFSSFFLQIIYVHCTTYDKTKPSSDLKLFVSYHSVNSGYACLK